MKTCFISILLLIAISSYSQKALRPYDKKDLGKFATVTCERGFTEYLGMYSSIVCERFFKNKDTFFSIWYSNFSRRCFGETSYNLFTKQDLAQLRDALLTLASKKRGKWIILSNGMMVRRISNTWRTDYVLKDKNGLWATIHITQANQLISDIAKWLI
jgi:hypothetical protein